MSSDSRGTSLTNSGSPILNSMTNLSITTERMQPFDGLAIYGNEQHNKRPYLYYLKPYIVKGALLAFIFVLVCILCYLVTTVHHLQSQASHNQNSANEALLSSNQIKMHLEKDGNSINLSTKIKK